MLADALDIQLAAATVKVYVPATRLEIVVPVPVPVVITPPGERVSVQVPVAGKPFKTTLAVETEHVGWVIAPTNGAEGIATTVSENVAVAEAHGRPRGLLVVTVMITVLPRSPANGV